MPINKTLIQNANFLTHLLFGERGWQEKRGFGVHLSENEGRIGEKPVIKKYDGGALVLIGVTLIDAQSVI